MGMAIYGLREARAMIAAKRQIMAKAHPRSIDPYVRGQRDALKALDDQIATRIKGYMPVENAPAILSDPEDPANAE